MYNNFKYRNYSILYLNKYKINRYYKEKYQFVIENTNTNFQIGAFITNKTAINAILQNINLLKNVNKN